MVQLVMSGLCPDFEGTFKLFEGGFLLGLSGGAAGLSGVFLKFEIWKDIFWGR